MSAILHLIIVCIEKLHLDNLVDAQAELIRSRAQWNYICAFVPYAFIVGVILISLIAFIAFDTLQMNKGD